MAFALRCPGVACATNEPEASKTQIPTMMTAMERMFRWMSTIMIAQLAAFAAGANVRRLPNPQQVLEPSLPMRVQMPNQRAPDERPALVLNRSQGPGNPLQRRMRVRRRRRLRRRDARSRRRVFQPLGLSSCHLFSACRITTESWTCARRTLVVLPRPRA